MFRKLLLVGVITTLMLGQLSFADPKSKKAGSSSNINSYFQIQSVTEKNEKLTFTGYWIVPDQVILNAEPSNQQLKIPPFKVLKYILPPCKSELEIYMDEVFGGGRDDWCSRLKAALDAVGMPYIDHEDFY